MVVFSPLPKNMFLEFEDQLPRVTLNIDILGAYC